MTSHLQQIKQDTTYSERTQISLSPTMRAYIDKKRRSTNESLSEYIRNAISVRVEHESESDEKKLEAAMRFFGAGKNTNNPNWDTPEKIRNWQRTLRNDNR
jgi:hypothetical protein